MWIRRQTPGDVEGREGTQEDVTTGATRGSKRTPRLRTSPSRTTFGRSDTIDIWVSAFRKVVGRSLSGILFLRRSNTVSSDRPLLSVYLDLTSTNGVGVTDEQKGRPRGPPKVWSSHVRSRVHTDGKKHFNTPSFHQGRSVESGKLPEKLMNQTPGNEIRSGFNEHCLVKLFS